MKKKYDLIDYFMIFAIVFFMLIGTMTVFGQTSIGVQTGVAVNVDKHMVGLSINQKWDSKNISTGIGYMTSTDNLGKGMFMINSQYHLNRFSIGGGVGLGGDRFTKTKPFVLTTYKPLKRYPLRFFFNYSEMRKTIGVMFPLIMKKK